MFKIKVLLLFLIGSLFVGCINNSNIEVSDYGDWGFIKKDFKDTNKNPIYLINDGNLQSDLISVFEKSSPDFLEIQFKAKTMRVKYKPKMQCENRIPIADFVLDTIRQKPDKYGNSVLKINYPSHVIAMNRDECKYLAANDLEKFTIQFNKSYDMLSKWANENGKLVEESTIIENNKVKPTYSTSKKNMNTTQKNSMWSGVRRDLENRIGSSDQSSERLKEYNRLKQYHYDRIRRQQMKNSGL